MQDISELLSRNEIKKAEVAIAKYLRQELSPAERAAALVYRARIRLKNARPDDAVADLHEIQLLDPVLSNQPSVIELLADARLARYEMATVGFADRNETLQARNLYEQLLSTFPDYMNRGWIHYQLGRIALTNGLVDQAEMHFQQALLSPSQVRGLTAFCYERLSFIAFYEKRSLKIALGFIDKAIDTAPSNEARNWLVQSHILRSRILRELRDYQEAVAAAETAVNVATRGGPELRSSLAEALFTAGEILAGFEGREKDVIAYLQQFLQISKQPLGIDVTWSRVYEILGDAYFKQGQYDFAVDAYESALQYNPYHPWSISLQFRIARGHYHQHKYAETISQINHLLQSAKADGETIEDYRVFDVLGNAYFALGRFSEAEDAYRTALSMAPPNAEGIEIIRSYYELAQQSSK